MEPSITPYFDLTVDADEFVYYYRYGLEQSVLLWYRKNDLCTHRSYREIYERRSEARWRPLKYKVGSRETFDQLRIRLIEAGIADIQSYGSIRGTGNSGDYIRFKLGGSEEQHYYVFPFHPMDSRHRDIVQFLQTFSEVKFR